jgi:lipopolysaccharide cholinephosphotransferase
MFAVFARICAEHGLQYWADAGTLLGTVRDGAIIAHDDDMDVCMYEEDIMHLKRALERDPVYEIALYDNWIWQMRKRGDPKEFWIDIFHMEDTEDRVQYKSARSRQMWPNGWYARTQLWPLRTMPFGDQDIFIPSLPEPYLTRMYGNWRIPVVWKRHGA